MKKHEIIKHAYENYPKGTVYTWAKDTLPREVTSSGKFYFQKNELDNDLELHDQEDKDLAVWNGEEWAEIVKTKIAVKVENEKEFKALMKYYDSLGWKWKDGCDPFHSSGQYESSDTNILAFNDKFNHLGTNKYPIEGYQIIPFADFAEEKGIKLPLFTSEDGVGIFIDDEIFLCYISSETKLPVMQKNYATKILYTSKVFKLEESALSWIDAQKPKEIIYNVPESKFTIKIEKNRVSGFDGLAYLDLKDMQYILKIMQELQK